MPRFLYAMLRQREYHDVAGVARVQFGCERIQSGADQLVPCAYRDILLPIHGIGDGVTGDR